MAYTFIKKSNSIEKHNSPQAPSHKYDFNYLLLCEPSLYVAMKVNEERVGQNSQLIQGREEK